MRVPGVGWGGGGGGRLLQTNKQIKEQINRLGRERGCVHPSRWASRPCKRSRAMASQGGGWLRARAHSTHVPPASPAHLPRRAVLPASFIAAAAALLVVVFVAAAAVHLERRIIVPVCVCGGGGVRGWMDGVSGRTQGRLEPAALGPACRETHTSWFTKRTPSHTHSTPLPRPPSPPSPPPLHPGLAGELLERHAHTATRGGAQRRTAPAAVVHRRVNLWVRGM